MADDKKDPKKGGKGGKDKPAAPAGPNFSGDMEKGIFIILVLAVAITVFYAILKSFGVNDGNSIILNGWVTFKTWLAHFLVQSINTLTFVSIFASIMLIMGAYYARFRRKEIISDLKYKDQQMVSQSNAKFGGGIIKGENSNPISSGSSSGLATVASAGTEQWDGIEKYMQSHNPSDWRLAILEADILLYDMLEQIGFQGDTIADKLKSVDPASFNTIDDAWKAHKVRNSLAHEGASYELNYDEARRTINRFKNVFNEFYFI